ncbi:MAG: EthD family reductase [Pseudomonadota bacterium]|nr:EthD family reductase [Pseudomonadota bacterium]
MFRVTIIYPDQPGARFDQDYYLKKHVPTMKQLLQGMPGFLNISVERSFDASSWGASFALMTCHYTFDSLQNTMLAMSDLAGQMRADIPKFSNVVPTVYVNELIQSHSSDEVISRFGDSMLSDLPSSWMAPR